MGIDPPTRVTVATKLLPELKIIPGFALDLITAGSDGRSWDFDVVTTDQAWRGFAEERLMLPVGIPRVFLHMVKDQQQGTQPRHHRGRVKRD